MEFNQRLAKSLPQCNVSRKLRSQVLDWALGRYVPEDPADTVGVGKGAPAVPAEQPTEEKGDETTTYLPTPAIQEVLGTPPLPDTDAKTLELALTTWELLKSLGFQREHADIALEYAPNLDAEECIAFLLFHLPDDEVRKLSLSTLEPAKAEAKEALELSYASAIDETHPPKHAAYEFSRTNKGSMRPLNVPEAPKERATTLDELPRGLPLEVWKGTEDAVADIQKLLDPDSPWTDLVEHPIDAYCTARIALLRVDQEKARRKKLLGKVLDRYLANVANEEGAQRAFAQICTRANDLMQQAEMQPAFHKKAAAERFKERMRLHQESTKTQVDERTRRRAEIEKAMANDEADIDERMNRQIAMREAKERESQEKEEEEKAAKAAQDELDRQAEQGDKSDGKEEGGESLFGAMLEEPEAAADNTQVRLREIAPSQGSRTPRALLTDLLKQIDPHASQRFTPVSGGSVCRSHLEVRWNTGDKKEGHTVVLDSYKLTTEGCVTQQLADDLVATVALNCLGRDRQVQRTLPTGFRAFWDELETLRTKEKYAFLRTEFGHVQELLERRASHPAPPRRQRRAAKNESTSRSQRRNDKPRQPSEELAQQYAARRVSDAYQAMLPGREQLPIAKSRNRILESVAHSQVVVLSGETGCGKSTQLPAYLLEDALARGKPCKIYVTEPRRISAISLAERVSQELGEARGAIGGPDSYIGYAIRLDSQIGRNARLIYATTGIALRMLESSAFDEITHIIIDEVHERSIESDFLLMVLKVLMQHRRDLKVILMSATLDADRISAYFGGCPMLHVPGRTFPVDVHYLEDALELCDYTLEPNSPYVWRNSGKQNRVKDKSSEGDKDKGDDDDDDDEEEERSSGLAGGVYSQKTVDTLAQLNEYAINYDLIAELLKKIFTEPRFDSMSKAVLVFLPGIGEIRQCQGALSGHTIFAPNRVQVHILHSSIAPEEQAEAFYPPPPGMRKIVLATNIAETGITIPDITCVVDTGRHREMRYDEKRKISRLVECFVARSNAKQRRGRAGRVQHGICFHLFTKMRHDEFMDPHPLPEMLRLSLQELALTLKVMQIQVGTSIEDALSQALDAPQAINVQRAVASLVEVQALTPNEEITPLGRHLCHMPLDVHLGKFLLIATRFRCVDAALTITAVLNSKSPFLNMGGGRFRETSRSHFNAHHSDFYCYINMYRGWRRAVGFQKGASFCAQYSLSQDILYQIEELRQQYLSYLADTGFIELSKEVRKDLSRNRTRNGRPRLIEVPAELDTYGECAQAVTLAMVAALYPKLLMIEPKSDQMRTLTNNQPAAIHPSSVNFRTHPSSFRSHFVLYHTIMMSKRLYAWDTAFVSDVNVLLAGGDAEFKHASRSLFLDHNRVRMATFDAKSLLALRVLRTELARNLQASYNHPGLGWSDDEQAVFALTLEVLGASHRMATTGKPEEGKGNMW